MKTFIKCNCGIEFYTDKEFQCCYYCSPKSTGTAVDFIKYFDEIDTMEKAYILGFLFNESKIYFVDVHIKFDMKHVHDIDIIRKFGSSIIRLRENIEILVTEDISDAICSSYNKYRYKLYIPESYRELFFRGYFEASTQPACSFSELDLMCLKDDFFKNSTPTLTPTTVSLYTNIDFLGKLYQTYLGIQRGNLYFFLNRTSEIKVVRKHSLAVLPSKLNESDTGFDLTVIEKVKNLTVNVELWDTGLVVVPPLGYYIEIVPRSSISKSGYMLANSVGIIDSGYRGTLMIALLKISASTVPVKAPWRCCQMILRKHENTCIQEYSSIQERSTARNTCGFGSSDNSN